jgi:hypothetical protein
MIPENNQVFKGLHKFYPLFCYTTHYSNTPLVFPKIFFLKTIYLVGLKAAIFTAEPRTYLKKCFENRNFNNVMRSNLDDFSGAV